MAGSSRSCERDIAESSKSSEKIYVAVTRRDLESKSSLVWAIQNSGGNEFCIVYVHQISRAMRFHRKEKEKEKVHKNLDKYVHICKQMQRRYVYIEMDSVEKGILQLISQLGVKKLVMGAVSYRNYSMNMKSLRSKKAIYISREAPPTCHIWFTCKGYLICSRSDPISVVMEAENSKREEVGKSAIDALKKAIESENVYLAELRQRKETEEALRKAKEELEKMRSESEARIQESDMVIRKLQSKYSLSMKALRKLREEQEELKIELREVSKMKSKRKNHEPPQYFICPITQDVMEDPHVAADGFTYEGEAISGWFERGHESSPMINKRLPHTSFVPNLALRSVIQEWLQASSS